MALGAVVLVLGAAACGGGGSKVAAETTAPTTAPTTTAATPPTTTTSPNRKGGTSTVTTGPVQGTLQADNHAPTVNRLWHYSVTVTDATGHPLSGIVDIEFVYGGVVVGKDTPPTHPVKNGHWQDTLKFPAAALGQPLTVRAVIHTRLGSITLDWPITVRR